MFLGIILRVLRLQVSVYNVYIINQFQSTVLKGGGGVKSLIEVTVNCPNYVQEFGLWTDHPRTSFDLLEYCTSLYGTSQSIIPLHVGNEPPCMNPVCFYLSKKLFCERYT
jgi:hypothetical protein